jgi:hypothetical protein
MLVIAATFYCSYTLPRNPSDLIWLRDLAKRYTAVAELPTGLKSSARPHVPVHEHGAGVDD